MEKDEFHEAMLTMDPSMSSRDIDVLFDTMDIGTSSNLVACALRVNV